MTQITQALEVIVHYPNRPELAVVAAGLSAALLFPDDLGFITRINILTIFALSVALVIGQAGIGTLGQASSVRRRLLERSAVGYPCFAGAAQWTFDRRTRRRAGVAAASGLLILRTRGLTLIMLSVAFAQVLLEIANKAASVRG